MGDVITGIDFASDSARERFMRRRQAIGLSLSDASDTGDDHSRDTAPSEYVAPDGDCA